MLGESLDAFLTEIHGDPVAAYALAARSYLESGYFDEARGALAEALARDPARADLRRASAYADGHERVSARVAMTTRCAISNAGPRPVPHAEEAAFRELALSAVTRLATLAEGAGQDGTRRARRSARDSACAPRD